MSNQNAQQDDSQFPSLIVASGTANDNTVQTRKITSTQTPGAIDVHIMGGTVVSGAGTPTVTIGTIPELTNLVGGTITRIGTVDGVGTLTNIGTLKGVDLVTRIGNIGTIESGTVTTSLALNTGTLTTIAAGTQNTLGTVGVVNNLVKGTITKLEGGTVQSNIETGTLQSSGTTTGVGVVTAVTSVAELVKGTVTLVPTVTTVSNVTNGTVRVSVGTIVGPTASGGTPTTAPVQIAGTDVTGTVYSPLVNVAGALSIVEVPKGTITVSNPVSAVTATVGTVPGIGTLTNVGSVTNIGTIKEAGTVTGVGVVTAVTSVAELVKGTVTLVPTVTTVSNLTNGTVRVALGTIIGPTASGGTPTTAPVQIAGTDVTGTVYSPLVTSAGAQTIVDLPKGTVTLVSTVTTLSNLTNGSANILTGTIQSSGTTTGVGVVTSVSELVKGTVTNLATGTINALAAGTITTGTVSVTTGTVVLNTGTITTIAAGTQNTLGTVGNLNNGSVNLLTGTVTSVTNLAAGTVQVNPTPTATTLTQGTLGTAGGSFFGTLSAASGAGTKHYITGLTIVVQSGTPDVRILAGTSIQGTGVLAAGAFVPSAGVSRDFTTNFATGTNSELTYHFVNAGTAFITVQYWKGA